MREAERGSGGGGSKRHAGLTGDRKEEGEVTE